MHGLPVPDSITDPFSARALSVPFRRPRRIDIMKPGGMLIKLDQFLKLHGVVETGGQAKGLIQSGQVEVNGDVETRRGRKLEPGDIVEVAGHRLVVEADLDEAFEP